MTRNRSPFNASKTLNEYFISKLGDAVIKYSDVDFRPLLLKLNKPSPLKFRVYLFNCGNPPGGRPIDEYKLVLNVDQKVKGEPGNFDFSDGYFALIGGYVKEYDVFVFWDATKHKNFGRNKNLQVKTYTIVKALCSPFEAQERNTNGGKECIIAVRSEFLQMGINKRMELLYKELIEV